MKDLLVCDRVKRKGTISGVTAKYSKAIYGKRATQFQLTPPFAPIFMGTAVPEHSGAGTGWFKNLAVLCWP